MKRPSTLSASFGGRASRWLLRLLLLLPLLLTGCPWDPLGLDNIVKEIEKTRQSIVSESTGWRDELQRLSDVTLPGMESKISADAKDILADTTIRVAQLRDETFKLAANEADRLVHEAGAEYRCNMDFNKDFVREGVVNALQYVIDDLEFWKSHKTHSPDSPIHKVCGYTPDVLQLYPKGNGWGVDTRGMTDPNIVRVFGYNFAPENLPTLELQTASGNRIRDLAVTAAYVTRYQFNLNFAGESFAGVMAGQNSQIVFRWRDQPDPSVIALGQSVPGRLRLAHWQASPALPKANTDFVTLTVSVTNDGGMPVEACNLVWNPDPLYPQDSPSKSCPGAIMPGATPVNINLGPYLFRRSGKITGTVSANTGDTPLQVSLTISPEPLPTACGPFGGSGGGEFTEMFSESPIGVFVSSGSVLDAIQIMYASGPGPRHGGGGGNPVPNNFMPGEYLSEVDIRSGGLVDSVTLYSNKRWLGKYGGNGGTPRAKCGGPGWRVVGIFGRSGSKIDSLGVYLRPVQ